MVHAIETRVRELLEGNNQYLVPLYQRTYSWTKAQHQRLWADLVRLAEERAAGGSQLTHFIGSLVLAPVPQNGPVGVSQFLVVDGQQRLTTLTLLLMAIRDHRVATEDPVHRARIDQQYLMNVFQNKPYRSKIVPTQTDRESYEACLLSAPGAGGGDGIGLAYSFFRGQLTTIDDPADPNDIAKIEEAVLFGLAVVSVTAQAGDNVYRIFESLNNTGRRLTQGDLLRNYLFMRLPTAGEVVYHEDWLPLQKSLSSDELGLLFWLDLVQEDPRAKQTETYAGQTARLERIKDEAGIRAEVKRLATLGLLLDRILRPEKEPDLAVRSGLNRLNAWGTTTVYPLLLHLLQRRQHGSATSEEIASAMRLIESFFVRRLLIGQATKNLNRILLSAVTEMSTDGPVDEALTRYLSTGRKFWANDAEVRRAAREQPFYWQGTAAQRSLVLRWLEETYGSNEKVDPGTLTVEHVLPQTPTTDWRRMFATDLAEGESLEQEYEAVLHTLGNLTLTGYNPALGNKPFEFKRDRLAATSILMSQEIAAQSQWRRCEILARADALADRAITLWPGPPPSAEPQEPQLWTVMNQVLAEIPAGTWTTYGDVAVVIGTHPVPVGQRLAGHPTPNAHRVLQSAGTVSPSFRWIDPNRTDDPVEVLQSEGIVFDNGHADPAQRLTAEDLAELIGVSTDGLQAVPEPDPNGLREFLERFIEQLAAQHNPDVVNGILALLKGWTSAGGTLQYGTNQTTSCFLMARDEQHPAGSIWPVAIYPTGKVEVVFQHLASRDPFADLGAREELRQRLNAVPGIDLPASKIQMRPSFPLAVLVDPQHRAAVLDVLTWMYDVSNAPGAAGSIGETDALTSEG